jgi:predicted nucleic acid-binding protein
LIVAQRVGEVDRVATCVLAYAEARATFARLQRAKRIGDSDLRRVAAELDRDWAAYQVIDITESLVRHAGTLAESHALRAYDAVQLASALGLRDAGSDVEFMSFDVPLGRAAGRERLTITKL